MQNPKITVLYLLILVSVSIGLSRTWIKQESCTGNDLNAIHFVNNNEGWIVGDAGILLQTEDGGNTWNKKILNTANNLTDIYFVNHDTGWIVSYSGDIFVTSDGGQNWQSDTANLKAKYLTSVYFYNEKIGWISSKDSLFKTDDGGKSWNVITSDAFFIETPGEKQHIRTKSITFKDSLEGYICGRHGLKIGPDYYAYSIVIKTSDGGVTWERLDSTEGFGDVIGFVDTNSIICAGEDEADAEIASKIYKSADNGVSWYRVYGYRGSLDFRYISFFDNNVGILISSWRFYYTTDAGETWQYQDHPTNSLINSSFFTSRDTGWIIGNDGIIYKTTNGGIGIEKNKDMFFHQNNIKLSYKKLPSNLSITIDFNQIMSNQGEIAIYNLYGRRIQSCNVKSKLNRQSISFNLKPLPSGIYFLHLDLASKSTTLKFVIK